MHRPFKRTLHAVIAGSVLIGGSFTAVMIAEAGPSSAASVVQTIGVGSEPDGISSDGTHVWVANFGGGITELNASTGSVVQTVPGGSGATGPTAISSDGLHVWIPFSDFSSPAPDVLSELNASTGAFSGSATVGAYAEGVSSDGTHAWVANGLSNTVTEVNASTGLVVQTIAVGGDPAGISSDGTHVWVANSADSVFGPPGNTVTELNASTGAVVQTIGVGPNPYGVSSDGTHVWVANSGNSTLTELNASNGAVVQTIGVGPNPYGVSSDGTHVWVANRGDGTVSELNASTGAVIQTIAVGNAPQGISSDGTHVWVANNGDHSVTELGPDFAISTSSLPPATRGAAYGPATLEAINIEFSTIPYTTTLKWRKISLPSGLKLSSTGVLSGIPSIKLAAGLSSVTIQVTEKVTTLKGNKKVKTTTTVQATIPLTIT